MRQACTRTSRTSATRARSAQRRGSSRAGVPCEVGTRPSRAQAHWDCPATRDGDEAERLRGCAGERNRSGVAERAVRRVGPRTPVARMRLDVDDVRRSSRGLLLDDGVGPCRGRRQQELRDREQDSERSSQGRATSHVPLSAMVRCILRRGQLVCRSLRRVDMPYHTGTGPVGAMSASGPIPAAVTEPGTDALPIWSRD
jgi:hypothetical protein